MEQHVDRGRGRPRRPETDEQVTQAVLDLLREQGPIAVNVAAVSARSGVARSTIYRRYQDRSALLGAALDRVTERGSPPEGLDVAGRLAWVLERVEWVVTLGIGHGGVAALLTDSDPEFTATLRRSLDDGLSPVVDQIESDVARGALVPDLDADLVVNLVLGSYLAETLRRGAPERAWRDQTVALLTSLLVPAERRLWARS